jgi:hypothetical protein
MNFVLIFSGVCLIIYNQNLIGNAMETIIRWLTEPRVVGDEVKQPTAPMLRAGRALKDLMQISARDRQLMFEKQNEALQAHEDCALMRRRIEILERRLLPVDFTEYNECINKDRE